MSTASEAVPAQSQLGSGLQDGLSVLSGQQTITFTKYVRLVLPADGFIFWVRAGLVGYSAQPNVGMAGSAEANSAVMPQQIATQIVAGSLHYATDKDQNLDETISVNKVLFSTTTEIQEFNTIAQDELYIGTFGSIRFAFSRRGNLYAEAGIYHYSGDAIYPAFDSQIIDVSGFDGIHRVVSNSLPLWLSFMQTDPFYPSLPVYPAFLVPTNAQPPYAVIHVQDTRAIQAFPVVDLDGGSTQLVKDKVTVTFYGLRNDQAVDFQNAVNEYSINYDTFGMMNTPVLKDEFRVQPELGILAQKKTIEYEISYYQSRADTVARQLIKSAVPSIYME